MFGWRRIPFTGQGIQMTVKKLDQFLFVKESINFMTGGGCHKSKNLQHTNTLITPSKGPGGIRSA